jgi:tetratricopeptide (TPR) repeat protein
MASIEEHRGNIDAAISRYETFLKASSGPQQVAANNLAMLLATYKNDRGSLDRARDLTASFSSSENSSLLDTQGWVRFKRAEYAQALPVLERAIARSPDSKIIRFHLAMTELQLGQRDRARSDLEAALSGPGTFAGAEQARVALAGLARRAG